MNVPALTIPYTWADWSTVIPAFVVAATALVVLIADLITPRSARRGAAVVIGVVGLAVAGVLAAQQWGHPVVAFGGAFITGGFTIAFEEIVVTAAILSLLLAHHLGREEQTASAIALLLWSATGAMLMAGAGNLMMVFLGLELLSLALYCLCGLSGSHSSREAALKYLILSSTASGFMLYGMALLFGATGSVSLASLLAPTSSPLLLSIGAGLFLVGLTFKLSLAPFHVWTPDVFEGAPLPVTAFMSVVTKAGALAVLARFAYAALAPSVAPALLAPVWVLAALSMIVGNVGALAQHD